MALKQLLTATAAVSLFTGANALGGAAWAPPDGTIPAGTTIAQYADCRAKISAGATQYLILRNANSEADFEAVDTSTLQAGLAKNVLLQFKGSSAGFQTIGAIFPEDNLYESARLRNAVITDAIKDKILVGIAVKGAHANSAAITDDRFIFGNTIQEHKDALGTTPLVEWLKTQQDIFEGADAAAPDDAGTHIAHFPVLIAGTDCPAATNPLE